MPDQPQDAPMPDRYRVTAFYADDVTPPLVAGDRASRGFYRTRADADIAIEEAVGRTDLGRIVLAVDIGKSWFDLHVWIRIDGEWKLGS